MLPEQKQQRSGERNAAGLKKNASYKKKIDPDKQRKWEEKEQRRLAKKRAPRMKQLKVKAL